MESHSKATRNHPKHHQYLKKMTTISKATPKESVSLNKSANYTSSFAPCFCVSELGPWCLKVAGQGVLRASWFAFGVGHRWHLAGRPSRGCVWGSGDWEAWGALVKFVFRAKDRRQKASRVGGFRLVFSFSSRFIGIFFLKKETAIWYQLLSANILMWEGLNIKDLATGGFLRLWNPVMKEVEQQVLQILYFWSESEGFSSSSVVRFACYTDTRRPDWLVSNVDTTNISNTMTCLLTGGMRGQIRKTWCLHVSTDFPFLQVRAERSVAVDLPVFPIRTPFESAPFCSVVPAQAAGVCCQRVFLTPSRSKWSLAANNSSTCSQVCFGSGLSYCNSCLFYILDCLDDFRWATWPT